MTDLKRSVINHNQGTYNPALEEIHKPSPYRVPF